MSVLERLAEHSRHDVQRIGLSARRSATPTQILGWLRAPRARRRGDRSAQARPSRARSRWCSRPTSSSSRARRPEGAAGKKSLFFCQSRALTEAVAERMRDRGTDVFVHHSSVSLEERYAWPRSASHGGTNAASSARRRSSSASTSAISIWCSRPTRPDRVVVPAAHGAHRPPRRRGREHHVLLREGNGRVCRRSRSSSWRARAGSSRFRRRRDAGRCSSTSSWRSRSRPAVSRGPSAWRKLSRLPDFSRASVAPSSTPWSIT
jgi:hypothetical protein